MFYYLSAFFSDSFNTPYIDYVYSATLSFLRVVGWKVAGSG